MIVDRAEMKGYKTDLDPNNVQRTLLLRHAGAARWAYNWGLNRKLEAYKAAGKSPSAIDLHHELNQLKKVPADKGGVGWLYEVSKCAPQESLRSLDVAFKNFFRRCKQGAAKKGFPRFKSKKQGIGGFRLTGSIEVFEDRIQLPRIGEIRLKEENYLPCGKYTSASITEHAGHWFASVCAARQGAPKIDNTNVIGIDVGIAHLLTLSDGTVVENPKALRRLEPLLRTRQKAVSKKVKGSANRAKAVKRLAQIHYRISNIRKDAIHKATSAVIAKQPGTIVIESLNVRGMMKNHCLAKSLADASLGEILRQVKYKAAWNGIRLVEALPFFPSSKTCYDCGHINVEMRLADREWTCASCGVVHDRDENAARNLMGLAGSSPATACCPGGSDQSNLVKLLVGQEPNTICRGIGG